MENKPTVYVIDDDHAILASLSMVMEGIGLDVRTFTNCRDFLDEYDPGIHGCLVLDVRMPDMSGLELQSRLAGKYGLPVIIITGHGDVPMAVEVMKAGAVEFIEKPFRDQILIDAIHKAIKLDSQCRDMRIKQDAYNKKLKLLTPREHQVIGLLAECKSNKEIAKELGIKPKTADFHSVNILDKLGLKSVTKLVRYSAELGLP